jgi:mannitol-1-phosphate/altronate dehydrogenase
MTACHDGVVHNYLAAMRLNEAARKLEHQLRLEVQESSGIAQALSAEEISDASVAIVAIENESEEAERFAALPVLKISPREAINDPKQVIAKAIMLASSEDEKAFVERKLFTFGTGQAIAAYLGAAMGFRNVRDAVADKGILSLVSGAVHESALVLSNRYKIDMAAHERYIDKMLARLANPWLPGEIKAIAADPVLKLSRHERLVRPLLGALEFGLPVTNLVWGVAAALCYAETSDKQAQLLQQRISTQGVGTVLLDILGGTSGAGLIGEIEKCWETMRKR